MERSHSHRQIIRSSGGHAQLPVPRPQSRLIKKRGGSDGTSLCLIAASVALVSGVQNFRVSLASDDGFNKKEYTELFTGTMEILSCCNYIFLTLHDFVPNLLPTPAALAPLKSLITCHPDFRIFRNTSFLVVFSYLILLDISLSFLWLIMFPVMAIVFIGGLYFKFSQDTGGNDGKVSPGSSNVVDTTNRKTTELKIIVTLTIGALFVMDQLPDHARDGFVISQFLIFLSTTVTALTRMMAKLPVGGSLPGIALASEMFHKTLLLLLLVTAHTVAAEWLGEDVVLLCLPEVIPVLLGLIFHLDGKPGRSSIISVDKMKPHKKSIVLFGAVVVAPLFAYLAISMDVLGLYNWCTTFLVSCGVSGILTCYLVFMISHWPREQVAAAGKKGASGMLKLWAYALLIAAAASLPLRFLLSVWLDLP